MAPGQLHSRSASAPLTCEAGGHRLAYHCTFFEIAGQRFSFGDYFKDEAIPMAWDLIDRSASAWTATGSGSACTTSDDEAEEIWRDKVGVPAERIQRMGDDNFWKMGDTGPCGYSSEIYIDKGAQPSDPTVAPEARAATAFIELWNLVFMQFNQGADWIADPTCPRRTSTPEPASSAYCRCSRVVTRSSTPTCSPPSSRRPGGLPRCATATSGRADVALRIMADHGRAMSMLVADGVLPSNEGRGYVLRRVVRRAVLAAALSGWRSRCPRRRWCRPRSTTCCTRPGPALVEQHDG